jgi:hypothetical protein
MRPGEHSRGTFGGEKAPIFAAIGEAITGLALLIAPQLVGRLLFDQDLAGIALPVARIAGIALIGLGVACWAGPAVGGMLFYSIAVALYLSYLGLFEGLTGILLWPAIALHAVLAALLGRVWLVGNQRSSGGDDCKD